MSLIQRWQVNDSLGKESSWATTVAATAGFAPTQPKWEDVQVNIYDRGVRGVAAETFAYFAGVQYSQWDWPDMAFYPDNGGHLLMGILGKDTPTTSASTTSHLIQLLRTSRPPSYTFQESNTVNNRVGAGVYFEEVGFKWANNGELKVSAKGKGKNSTTVASSTTSITTASLIVPWQAATTVNALSNTHLLEMDMTLSRRVEAVFGANATQAPTDMSVAGLEVKGKATFYIADDTELNLFENNTQGNLKIFFNASTASQLTLQMTKCAFESPTVYDKGKDYVILQASFIALDNTTDGGPLSATLVNLQTAAY